VQVAGVLPITDPDARSAINFDPGELAPANIASP
jgi:hypothetical protein